MFDVAFVQAERKFVNVAGQVLGAGVVVDANQATLSLILNRLRNKQRIEEDNRADEEERRSNNDAEEKARTELERLISPHRRDPL